MGLVQGMGVLVMVAMMMAGMALGGEVVGEERRYTYPHYTEVIQHTDSFTALFHLTVS